MSRRQTRKAGILQSRHPDLKIQKAFDAIIERIEVIDGLRGDPLDQAVTYRDLQLSGFTLGGGVLGSGSSAPPIVNTPGPGDGTPTPGTGPADAPSNLTVTETWLALLLNWDNPPLNLQHIEIWRASTDNLSTAVLIGTSVASLYVDYVGASASFYYWVRAVGTDGTYSAYNDTAGTLGTTGIDPSDWVNELNISAENLDAALRARIDLIDIDGLTDSLLTRIAAAEGDIVDVASRATALEAGADDLTIAIDGNTTLITANTQLYNNQQSSITQILADLTEVTNDIADNAQAIVVNSSAILDLTATVGALDAEGGETWEFLDDTEDFDTANASISHNGTTTWPTGSIYFTPNDANPVLFSPTISLSGGIFTQVVMRVRQTIAGGTWEGNCYYRTGGHSENSAYVKTIADPGLVLGEWKTLTWDMANLTAGGTDWTSSTITRLRWDLVSDAAGKFEIDWIIVAKFSTTAFADALAALDARITVTEAGIVSQATELTLLTATVNDNTTGVVATSEALNALTVTVGIVDGNVTANAQDIATLQSSVNDPVTGVLASANAVDILETNVSTIEGTLTSQASSVTQLVARLEGGRASLVNTLTGPSENFGTTFAENELQSFNVGGRVGTAAVITTDANIQDKVYKYNGDRLYIEPNGIYEVSFSVYHNRNGNLGRFYAGLYAYNTATGGTLQNVNRVINQAVYDFNSNPYWIAYKDENHDAEWLDFRFYILGADVDPSLCPNPTINGQDTGFSGYLTGPVDGLQIITAPYVELRFLNYSGAGYGDSLDTTTYVTNLNVHRVEGSAENYAALQVQANVLADDVGNLQGLYAVQIELTSGGDPYVAGFGLAADMINGQYSSAFGVQADQFYIVAPNSSPDSAYPFLVDLVDGSVTVGINGSIIVDGTIRGTSIEAESITAGLISVDSLDALSSDMGFIAAGTFSTKSIVIGTDINGHPIYGSDTSAFRVEIEDQAGTEYPLWYGSGAKGPTTGLFFVDEDGNVTVKGTINSGLIRTSYFAPSGSSNYTFRIATDPSLYSAGVYTGKVAHLNATKTYSKTYNGDRGYEIFRNGAGAVSDYVTFYSPTNTSDNQYGRCGNLSETFICFISANFEATGNYTDCWVELQYRYDSAAWKTAWYSWGRASGTASISHYYPFISKTTSWSTLDFRIVARKQLPAGDNGEAGGQGLFVRSMSMAINLPNFGYADQTLATPTSGTGQQIPAPSTTGDGDIPRIWL